MFSQDTFMSFVKLRLDIFTVGGHGNRLFHKHTELTIMAILASEALPLKNTNPSIKCYPGEY